MSSETKSIPYLAVVLLLIWLGFVYQPGISMQSFIQELFVGIIVAVAVTILTHRHFEGLGVAYFHPRRVAYFIAFFFVFLWEMVKANLNMARIVLSPELPIKPGIVKVSTSLKQPAAKLFLGNAITLTPGTLTIDYDDGGAYIHWVEVKDEDMGRAGEIIKGRFERLLRGVFS
ncbi:MAG: Na+/H+ antiporter subunit E [Thermoplasmata archaeon]|nr:Na+/H+ antiporter subunit E [Thermoplasmata archaeon]